MQCFVCANLLIDGSKFCNECGAAVPQNHSISNVINAPGSAKSGQRRTNDIKGRGSLKRVSIARAAVVVILFACGWLGWGYFRNRQNQERFARQIRCAQLAQEFARSRANDTVEVVHALYSSRRNSCLAVLERRNTERYFVQVVDPASGEVIWVDGCYWKDECTGTLLPNIIFEAERALNGWADRPMDRPRNGNVPRN